MIVSYPKLTDEQKYQVMVNLEARRSRYVMSVLSNTAPCKANVVIVGDRPGGLAPKDPNYHHTPFYSTKYCSGWLNALLLLEGIDEGDLVWINAYDKDGKPTSYDVLERIVPNDWHGGLAPIIALGGNAARWLKPTNYVFVQTHHPQFHKRFKNKERYELPELIRSFVNHEYG